MARRIVLDSDDEDEDDQVVDDAFPSPRLPQKTRTAKIPMKKPAKPESAMGTVCNETERATRSSVVRRRKLGQVKNSSLLLHSWDGGNEGGLEKNKPGIDVPPAVPSTERKSKPRVQLRTRKTRRLSELPADDGGEISTEEATVLEDISVGANDSNDEVSEFCDTSDDDLSSDSLDGIFRSPNKSRTAPLRERMPNKKGGHTTRKPDGPEMQSISDLYAEETSSVFFSAEESLAESLTNPISQITLNPPPTSKPAARKAGKAASAAPSTRPATPPSVLLPKQQPFGLVSPTKKLPHIPKTPHRPSTDAFWNQQVVDDWNMEHSPRKLLFDNTAKRTTGTASPPSKNGGSTAVKKREAKKSFQATKNEMADNFLSELDHVVTNGELGRLAATTGGVRIIWTNKLNTTAGRANWRRETVRSRQSPGTANVGAHDASVTRILHHASIELAEKVIDDENRLLNVIAHEFCHLANFMVSGITKNPHGKEFKEWADKCSKYFGNRGIRVTTKHSYEIDFKYVWTCVECATEFKRHSKSINPERHRCGACRGLLQQTKPMPRGGSRKTCTIAAPSAYQQFIKDNMAVVRKENPGSPQKMIMKLVADKWTQAKLQKSSGPEIETREKQVKRQPDAGVDGLGEAFVDLTLN